MPINKQQWLNNITHWKKKWPQLGLPEFNDDSRGVNLYKFIEILNNNLKEDSCLVCDAGSSLYAPSQGLQLKGNQRFVLDSTQAGMGGWQSSIGVCLARGKETIVLTGDGSIMTGVESLAVIKYNKLPIKIFIWNNAGYLSIRNSQDAFYGGRRFGTDSKTGLYFPCFKKLAESYELEYLKINNNQDLDLIIKKVMIIDNPCIIEVMCDPDQKIQPSLAYKNGRSCPLQDMSPYISDEDMELEMIKD